MCKNVAGITMRKSTWHRKPSNWGNKPSRLRVRHPSDTNYIKDEIQALCRQIALIRDEGCVLRNYPETGQCGGYRKDGELILQFDHLNSRVHSISFGDTRFGVIVCKRHHLYYKRQYPFEYERAVIDAIGPERAKLLYRVREDRTPYKADWKLIKLSLEQELKNYALQA